MTYTHLTCDIFGHRKYLHLQPFLTAKGEYHIIIHHRIHVSSTKKILTIYFRGISLPKRLFCNVDNNKVSVQGNRIPHDNSRESKHGSECPDCLLLLRPYTFCFSNIFFKLQSNFTTAQPSSHLGRPAGRMNTLSVFVDGVLALFVIRSGSTLADQLVGCDKAGICADPEFHRTRAVTLRECREACWRLSKCEWYSFDPSNNGAPCKLTTKCTELKSSCACAGCIHGIKECYSAGEH